MRTSRNRRSAIGLCLTLQRFHHGSTIVGVRIKCYAVVFVPIGLKVLCFLVRVLLFLTTHLKLKVLVMKIRSAYLVIKGLELDGLLVCLILLFGASTFTEARHQTW